MIFFPTQQSIIAQLALEEYRASYMAVTTFAFTLPNIIGPAIGGLIMAQAPAYSLWVLVSLACILAAIIYLILHPRYSDLQVGGE